MADFSVSWAVTETMASMTARLTNGDSSFIGTRYLRVYVNGSLRSTLSDSSGGGSDTFTYTIRNLLPGTRYSWDTELGYKAEKESSITWVSSLDRSGTFTTDEERVYIDQWSWTSSNGSATALQTRAAYSAVTNNGTVKNFSYLVWNDLVDKAKEVFDANGYSWDNRFASYYSTRMSASDRILTAARFNSLRYNIGIHSSTGIQTVYSGDPVYGWYLTQLVNSLNALI